MKLLRFCTSSALAFLLILISNTTFAAGLGTQIAVRLTGTGFLFDGNELFEEFGLTPDDALCYELDLRDVKTGEVIGLAYDCLTNITPAGSGVALTGTTFFLFPGGTLVSQGLTTVQPILHGSPDFTHITGAIPSPGDDNVVFGSGKFNNASGTVRLSGAVNLGGFPGEATFDCVFIIDVGG
jgi:hypothetical protein